MRIEPLCEALGAEVSGLDLTAGLADADAAALREAFFAHHLLCFRTEPLATAEFARVARYFGEPQMQLLRYQRDGEAPEVNILESTYHTAEDKPDDLREVRLTGWHTDDSYFARPAKATMLQSLEIPDSGGQTKFANTHKAYLDLPAEKQQRLAGLQAVHGYDTMRAPARAKTRTAEEQAETPDVVHPLIRTNDESGKKAIYYNANRTDHVVGMDRADSDALLDALYAHLTQAKYQYHHEWRVGDLLLWDNRCLVHAVNTDFPIGQTRRHQRILLKGTAPV